VSTTSFNSSSRPFSEIKQTVLKLKIRIKPRRRSSKSAPETTEFIIDENLLDLDDPQQLPFFKVVHEFNSTTLKKCVKRSFTIDTSRNERRTGFVRALKVIYTNGHLDLPLPSRVGTNRVIRSSPSLGTPV
jgi:hypothetical protein